MNKQLLKDWIDALRSGKYKQGHGALFRNGKYCCLGVLMEIAYPEDEWEISPDTYGIMKGCATTIPEFLLQDIGLHRDDVSYLIEINDKSGYSFTQIADYLEENFYNKVE